MKKTLFSHNLTLGELKELIKNGADANIRNSNGETPLHDVNNVNNLKIAQLLIKHGANVNARDRIGQTPLYFVNNLKIAQLLIKHGANVNAKSHNYERTPLHYTENDKIALELIKNGADVNAQDNYGFTPLSFKYDVINTAIILIKYGAVPSSIRIYQKYHHSFSKDLQKEFDIYQMLSCNDKDFFQMCLAYQNGIKNHVKMEVKDMEIV